MKIILLTDVKKLGKKDEILNVNDGYACNYLIPKKIAIPFNSSSQNYLFEKNRKIQIKKNEEFKKALYYQKKMQKITLYFFSKCNPDGSMVGIISYKQIEKKLEEFGIFIDKKNFLDKKQINQFGLTKLKIILFENVIGVVNIIVNKKLQ